VFVGLCVGVFLFFEALEDFLKTIFGCVGKASSFAIFGLCVGLCGFGNVCNVGWLLKNKKCISAKNKTLSGWLVRSAFLSCQYFVFLSFHNGLLFNIQSVVSVFYTWW